METIVVPNLEIDLHILSWHDAEAVHVELVEERRARLLEVQRHRFDNVFLDGFLDLAIEGQLAEAVVVGDETGEIDIRRKLFVERLDADVGVGIGQHIDGEGEGLDGSVPTVFDLHFKLGGLCGNKLVFKNIVLRGQSRVERVAADGHLLCVARRETESELGALRDDEPRFGFQSLVGAVDIGWIAQLATVGE